MKLKNMIIGFLALSLMTVSLTACGNAGNNTEATEITTEAVTEETTEETSNEAEVTEEPTEETVEPEVTEAPEPTEETVSDNPNVVDGIDFTEYYNGPSKDRADKSDIFVWDIMEEQANYDSLRIVFEGGAGVEAILSDGESAIQQEENGCYNLYLYVPKPVKTVEKIGGDDIEFMETAYTNVAAMFWLGDKATGTDVECGAKVTYKDGTEETITVYITKDYTIK